MGKDIAKSSEMPDPKIMDYNGHYKLSDLFVNDLKKVLGDIAYVDAKKFFDKIDQHNRIMSNAQLTEFINEIQGLPYKVVAQLMGVINKKENFLKYFVPCDLPKQNQ